MRLDQWLWAVRLYRSRTLAAESIKAGKVQVDGKTAKPSHEMKPGEVVSAVTGIVTRTYRAIAIPPARVGAKLVPEFAEDLTPPEELAKHREPNLRPPAIRPRGTGRPTKRERRAIDSFGEE